MPGSLKSTLKSLAKKSGFLTRAVLKRKGFREFPGLEALDAYFDETLGGRELDAAAVAAFARTWMRFDAKDAPRDPFSPAYREWQLALYNRVAERAYASENEVIDHGFDAEHPAIHPYNANAPALVEGLLHTQAFLVGKTNLPPGGSILEVGSGWAHLSVTFALMGYKLTLLEINPGFLGLARHRLRGIASDVRYVNEDMVAFTSACEESFDGVVFNASFHHGSDPLALMANLARIVKPGGAVYLSGEPVFRGPHPCLPYPWGLRLDGESLYMGRRHGWLELGFQHDFFEEAWRRHGFRLESHDSGIPGVPELFIARRDAAAPSQPMERP